MRLLYQTIQIISVLFIGVLFLNCDCPPLDKSNEGIQKHIDASPQIVKVFGKSNEFNKYEFTVLEVFKGSFLEGQIIKGEAADNCELVIRPGVTYVLFGYMDQQFHTIGCGMSFDIDKPFPLFPPPPPFPQDTNNQGDYTLIRSELENQESNEDWSPEYDHEFANRIKEHLIAYRRQKETPNKH